MPFASALTVRYGSERRDKPLSLAFGEPAPLLGAPRDLRNTNLPPLIGEVAKTKFLTEGFPAGSSLRTHLRGAGFFIRREQYAIQSI